MANHRYASVTYKPRYGQWEAFDLCHPDVREALNNALTVFDTNAMLRYQRQHGVAATLRWIGVGNREEAKRPWIKARGVKGTKGYVPAVPNSCVALGLRPMLK
jgi:hypothetical protein